jgi:hypothetical protein
MAGGPARPVPALDHIVVVLFENRSLDNPRSSLGAERPGQGLRTGDHHLREGDGRPLACRGRADRRAAARADRERPEADLWPHLPAPGRCPRSPMWCGPRQWRRL